MSKCFCHFNGYEVKDATARAANKQNEEAISVERERISQLSTLQDGSTTGDAELMDARIGFDGVTHANLGAALRNQAKYLDDKLRLEAASGNLLHTITPENGYYYEYASGVKAVNDTYMAYPFVKVEPSTLYAIGVNSGTHIAYFDRYKNHISGEATDGNVITTPERCEYLCFSCAKTLRTTTILQKLDRNERLPSGKKIAHEQIPDLSVDDIKGMNGVIRKIAGENMLDFDCGAQNYYIEYNMNFYNPVDGYTAMIINAEPLTKYSGIGCGDNVHIAYLNGNMDNVGGEVVNHAFTITTPENCEFIAISVKTAQKESAAFCEGETAAYSAHGSGGIYRVNTRRILEVGSGKEYATITAAVNAAMDGDTVLVYPGTYTESVKCIYKTITIEGVSKRKCILTYPNGDYSNPPLEMASGVLKNMTVEATYQAKIDGAVDKAYAMHTDNGALTNNAFYVENVDFVNADNQTIGIGLKGNCYLEFVNCSFICQADDNAFYCHDNATGAAINQRLIVNGCTFVNNGASETIRMQTQDEAGSNVLVTWQRNIVRNTGSGDLIKMVHYTQAVSGDGWMGATGWMITPESAMNTLADLNA